MSPLAFAGSAGIKLKVEVTYHCGPGLSKPGVLAFK